MSQFWAVFLLGMLLVVCVLLIVVILLQKGRGGGLGAAFGGMGSAAFGTRTGDVFTWVTIVLTALFLLLAIGASALVRPPKTLAFTPTFAPSPKKISEMTKVTINTMTRDAVIYYTLDKSNPTENSKKYDSPIPVAPGTTVKAVATRKDMDNSQVAEAYYGFEKAASAPDEESSTKPFSVPGASLPPTTTVPASVPSATAPAKAAGTVKSK